jgi:uncharacterized protein YlaI
MIKRNVSLRSKKRINRVSKKHRINLAVYSDARKTYLLSNPYCEVCGCEATDIHHKARRGKNLNNTDTWMAICRLCHQRVESNGKWAREMGYLE